MGNIEDLLDKRAMVREGTYKLARWASEEEAQILYANVIEYRPDLIVECGTANGWTIAWMAAAALSLGKKIEVITVDISNRPKFYIDPAVEYVVGDFSLIASDILEPRQDISKLIFLDGDHSYNGVRRDWDSICSYIKSGDVVLFHDSKGERGVRRCVRQLKRSELYYAKDYKTHNGITRFQVPKDDGNSRDSA